MGTLGGSRQSSDFNVQQFPGLFGSPEGQRVGGTLESLLGQGTGGSAFANPFQQAVLNPQFGPTTGSEQGFLKSIMDLTQGAAATRGLGPATQGGLAQNLAAPLMQLRQQQIGNLGQGIGQDLQARGQDIQGLIELAGLVMPQLVGGNTSSGKSGQFGIAGAAPGLGKI